MSYGAVTAAETASDVASSGPSPAAASCMPPSPPSDRVAAAGCERLQAGLMLLALLSLTVAFWAAVIGLAIKA